VVGGWRVVGLEDVSPSPLQTGLIEVGMVVDVDMNRFELGLGWFGDYDGYDLASLSLLAHGPPVSVPVCDPLGNGVLIGTTALPPILLLRSLCFYGAGIACDRCSNNLYPLPPATAPLPRPLRFNDQHEASQYSE